MCKLQLLPVLLLCSSNQGSKLSKLKDREPPPLPRRVALGSVETQTEIQTVHIEVQTTSVSVLPQITLVSIETQTIEVRDEMEDRRQRDKEKQVSPIYPWDHMHRAARETEEQPHKLLPLHEAPTGRNNQSMRITRPFSYQEIQRIEEDLRDYLEDPEKYLRAYI